MLCKYTKRWGSVADHDIEREGRRLSQTRDQSDIDQTRREYPIRASVCICVCSIDSLNDHNILILFGRSLEKDICPSIDEETILGCVSSLPRVSDTIGLVARLSEFSIRRKAVFQVAAYRPRLDGKLDRLFDRIHGIAIAAFQVDRHRQVRCSDDPAQIVDHQGKWDTLAIGEAVQRLQSHLAALSPEEAYLYLERLEAKRREDGYIRYWQPYRPPGSWPLAVRSLPSDCPR